jgi:hypothetical protein
MMKIGSDGKAAGFSLLVSLTLLGGCVYPTMQGGGAGLIR